MSEKRTTKKRDNAGSAAAGSRVGGGDNGPMDVRLLQRIVELMAANDLNTVDVRDGQRRIILKRGAVAAQVVLAAPGAAQPAPAAAQPAAPAAGGGDDTAGLVPIKSPMVGTFYAASSPDAKAFVQVGSVVNEESDVCIIEAMKTFNNVKAECRGTVARILVQNGQPVQFGTVMFLVKPS